MLKVGEIDSMKKNEVLSVISNRRSIRSFEDKLPTKEQIEALLKAAMESPSAKNLQPWHFSIVTNMNIIKEISDEAQKVLQTTRNIFFGAPYVIVISADPNAHYWMLDSGIAAQNITLAAESMKLGSIMLGRPRHAFHGKKKDYFKTLLKIPESYEFVLAIEIGFANSTKPAHVWKKNKIDYVE